MADQAPAGRGQGDGKGGRKLKFAPTVPSRRKKAEDGAAAPSAAEAAAANEAFQDLIKAAQSESKWERGRGRGFGRGRVGMGAQHVTFGGGDDSGRRPVGVAPPPARLPGIRQMAGSSSAAAASGKKLELKSKLKSDPTKADGSKAPASYDAADGDNDSEDLDDSTAGLFDFNQYYPTSLPLSLHHPQDDAADPAADAALMRQGVPQDLVLRQDDSEDSAQHLGLTDLSAAEDYLYLFQLPAALPLAAAAAARGQDPGGSRRAAANGNSSSAAAAFGLQRAAGIKELPSGKIGKLLIFQSGKVKLQIGDVLLDVTAGVPCVTRQDVAAVNASAKMLVNLGPVTQRAVVCPDVWQLMADQEVPQWQRAAAAMQRQRLGGAAEAAAAHAEMHAAAAAANGKTKGSAAADDADGMDVDSDEQHQQEQEQEDDENLEDSMSEVDSPKAKAVIESSSEEKIISEPGSSRESTPAAVKQEAAAPAARAAASPAVDDEVMNLLGLPTGAAAAAERGKGRFRPAAGRPTRGVKKEDGMDVDR